MRSYLDVVAEVRDNGEYRPNDRTGVGTIAISGIKWSHDLREGFPLVTVKKTSFKNILTETLWIIRGEPHLKFMHDHGAKHWDPWALAGTDYVGKMYGYQWRRFNSSQTLRADQLEQAINQLRENRTSRQILVSAWNPLELHEMSLPPCHFAFQFRAANGMLDTIVYMRSCDLFIGLPYDVGMYALLAHMVGHLVSLTPRNVCFLIGDAHIYENHQEHLTKMFRRPPKQLPTLTLEGTDDVTQIDHFTHKHFVLQGYESWDAIKAPLAI